MPLKNAICYFAWSSTISVENTTRAENRCRSHFLKCTLSVGHFFTEMFCSFWMLVHYFKREQACRDKRVDPYLSIKKSMNTKIGMSLEKLKIFNFYYWLFIVRAWPIHKKLLRNSFKDILCSKYRYSTKSLVIQEIPWVNFLCFESKYEGRLEEMRTMCMTISTTHAYPIE